MDVHISLDVNSQSGAELNLNETASLVNPESIPCADLGGHCSHHQVHFSGLVRFTVFQALYSQPELNSFLKSYTITRKLTPPFRPPIT